MPWVDGKYCVAVDEARGVYREARPLVRNARDGSVLALVPGGEFEMGVSSEKHRVHADAFYIGVYCVTNRQYARYREEVGSGYWYVERGKEDHPVVKVNWDDASAYAEWAGCELPTEAQWEKAARGPNYLFFPWGDDWDVGKCRNDENKGSGQTCAVWEYPAGASGYGTCNQSGNVSEWCRDWYQEWYRGFYLTDGVEHNPKGPASGRRRSTRGGEHFPEAGVSSLRAARRDSFALPSYRGDDQGFRLVRTA